MRYFRYALLGLVALAALLAGPAPVAQAATFTVNSTGNAVDANPGNGTCATAGAVCTLRAAVQEANHANNPGLDTINFNISPGGVKTITQPGGSGGALTVTDPVKIDGTTQDCTPGAPPCIELVAGVSAGVRIEGGGSTVKGLVINGSQIGIMLVTNGGNTIQGNYIGTDVNGTSAPGNNISGIDIRSPNNTIGGTAAGEGNLISGNVRGIFIRGSGATGNVVQGNLIGTDVNGTADLGNSSHGIVIDKTPGNNTIGGTTGTTPGGPCTGACNVISGNDADGVHFLSGGTGNVVQGNYIGTDETGTSALGNSRDGVRLGGSSPNNTIGGTAAGAGNVISGNGTHGVHIAGTGAAANQVQGNLIGTDVNGTADLGNAFAGVFITFGQGNTIGGTTGTTPGGPCTGACNVISGNDSEGVIMANAMGNVVQGNYIGTDVNGTADLGNAQNGVNIGGSPNSTIGGTEAGAGNVISGNDSNGVSIGIGDGTVVQGNYIGTDVTGTSALGNVQHGILTSGVGNNTIGGTEAAAGNLISGNGGDGVNIQNFPGRLVSSNSIHSNTGLGIDLGTDGVTANDPNDGDGGANGLQNFPTLTLATSGPATTTIGGDLDSTASTTFTIEFFSNIGCDPSGNGEGESFLGSTMVTTDVNGDVSFSVSFLSPVPTGKVITATATDPSGNTSEFSSCEPATLDSDDDGVPDASDNCPAWPNADQLLPPWSIPADDPDCDGFSTTDENFIGTDPNLACGPNAWPPDHNDDGLISISDVLLMKASFGAKSPDDPIYDARRDLNPDGKISISDVLMMKAFFDQECSVG